MIVPTTGTTMLTTAHTNAATANGSTRGARPQPPAPPDPPAPVGSGSGPTGTALVVVRILGRLRADIGATLPTTRSNLVSPR